MITDDQYEAWLKNSLNKRVVLIEYNHLEQTEDFPILKTGYASNHSYISHPTDTPANQPYDDILVGDVTYNRSINYGFEGGSNISKGDISLAITPQISSIIYNWFDFQQINIFLGDESWPRADFRKVMTGNIKNKRVENGQLIFSIRDSMDLLNVPFKRTYVASGVSEGQAIPLCFGECFNITPLLIDDVNSIYKVHDNWIFDVMDVRDDGVSVGFSWNFAQATITLDDAPSGQVTADVKGMAAPSVPFAGYKFSCPYIAKSIIINYGAAQYGSGLGLYFESVDDVAFDAMHSGNSWRAGIYITDVNTTLLQAVEQILKSIGAHCVIKRDGEISIAQTGTFGFWFSILEILKDEIEDGSVKIKAFLPPEDTVSLGFRKNWTIQSSVAGSVTEENRKIYSSPHTVASGLDNNVQIKYPGCSSGANFETLLADATETGFELFRRLAIVDSPRTVFELNVLNSIDLAQLGDAVYIRYTDNIIGNKLNGGVPILFSSYERINTGFATIEVIV